MKIIMAALGRNRVIGVDGTMPWWIPKEYQMFLDTIAGNSVIFGRKTYGYFSKELPAKHVFILTSQDVRYENAVTCHSFEEAIQQAERYPEDIYIAGGGAIYEQALDVADKMYLSYIKGDYDGDTFFPEFDESAWQIERREDYPQYEFVVYKKV